MRKLYDSVAVLPTLNPATYSTDTTGTDYVDTKGYRDGMLCVVAGAIGTTTADTYTITLKESDTTNGTYSSTGISLQFNATEDNTIKKARIAELMTTRKRYLRADLSCSATTRSFIGGVSLLLTGSNGPVNS